MAKKTFSAGFNFSVTFHMVTFIDDNKHILSKVHPTTLVSQKTYKWHGYKPKHDPFAFHTINMDPYRHNRKIR